MSTFVALHVTRSHVIHLPAALHQVFPLFEPLGEKHWAAGWDPEMLYPPSGVASVGTIFTTHHANEPAKIWTIIAYEREQAHVTYFNILPGSHTSWIDVRCESAGTQASIAHITYTLTALTPQGNTYLAAFTQEYYQTWIASWQTAISHYLLHGQMFSHEEE
ncbi:hypothetical protein [Ktedonobacter robiniae]|uniref:SRPBCC family protein n=1 Tax=Ktedonobacter robiniae TaxID=2778365 RepID=A0ABQ3UUU4_9CHLR|nr:hypothetical protein [Ktedonobacter robiniae]GHO56437.1 hypothetical protein KSB_49120 [Ktedonobacter robiniae]